MAPRAWLGAGDPASLLSHTSLLTVYINALTHPLRGMEALYDRYREWAAEHDLACPFQAEYDAALQELRGASLRSHVLISWVGRPRPVRGCAQRRIRSTASGLRTAARVVGLPRYPADLHGYFSHAQARRSCERRLNAS